MNSNDDGPVNPTTALHPLILQRAGAAAANFQPSRDHWILVAADGGSVRRIERADGSQDPPRESQEEHAFLVAGTGAEEKPRARIVRMVVDIQAADGTVKRDVEIPVENLDALFFGEGAVQKFVVPYYCAAFSVGYGMKLSEKWQNDPAVAAFCHTPWSEDCSTDDDGLHARGTMKVL